MSNALAKVACLVAVCCSVVDVRPVFAQQIQSAEEFFEPFDGSPETPQAWSSPRWDIVVHHRSEDDVKPMIADHDMMCAPPPGKHSIQTTMESVFLCKNHLMTAIDSSATGYAVIYLTPAAVLDWSSGPARIEFDISTFRTTKRDWIDIWLTPWSQNLALPLLSELPDLSGPPSNAIHIQLVNEFGWSITRFPSGKGLSRYDYVNRPVQRSAKFREKFVISIADGRLRMAHRNERSGQLVIFEDVALPADLGFDKAVVQFGHHSYTPNKDCHFMSIEGCGPNTWHWDNIKLTPAESFTMTKFEPIRVEGSIPVSPGWLRFAARGKASVNWGHGWVPVDPANGPTEGAGYASYFIQIPKDATEVRLRGQPTWIGEWRAKDISIWRRKSD